MTKLDKAEGSQYKVLSFIGKMEEGKESVARDFC